MPRPGNVRAVHSDTREPLAEQPSSMTRDRFGCFAGCRAHGCDATRCADLKPISRPSFSKRTWEWEVDVAKEMAKVVERAGKP